MTKAFVPDVETAVCAHIHKTDLVEAVTEYQPRRPSQIFLTLIVVSQLRLCTVINYRPTMTTDEQSATQQERQQPLSLSHALRLLSPLGDLGLQVRRIPNVRQDPPKQQAFLRSMLEQAHEIANSVDEHFSDESSSPTDNANGEQEENSRS
jgi:hypothetical protein